jgi:hypothetical protein
LYYAPESGIHSENANLDFPENAKGNICQLNSGKKPRKLNIQEFAAENSCLILKSVRFLFSEIALFLINAPTLHQVKSPKTFQGFYFEIIL